ncbi:MAG: phenylalanine--tRNA ligase subunit beta [Candidatus Methanofastidiosa archaeon]|nr:phenylalanine--tRNA ligase subunit beta [Candidatus Methanofastidiosa archaeon]
MPTLEISCKDLSRLLGRTVTVEELDDLILYAKGEIDGVEGDMVKVDQKDTNRPDLWSTEGIARQLRGILSLETGLPDITIEESDVEIFVDPALADVRPYCVNAVVKGLDIDEAFLSQIIQLQEKVALTYGRKRREVAVGIIDYDRIVPPIYYRATGPEENAFVPLSFSEALTPSEILSLHPKGQEYRHLVEGHDVYPLLVDSEGTVLTMPPIINSEHTGKVTTETKNVFVDVTGYDIETLKTALNVIVSAFAERGATIYSVTVHYPGRKERVPDLTPRTFSVSKAYVQKTLGMALDDRDLVALLAKMRYDAFVDGDDIVVSYAPYRDDIMHENDVLEDLAIAYGYNSMVPDVPDLSTTGRLLPLTSRLLIARELMVGLGYQEIVTFTLSSSEMLFERMGVARPDDVVEIENPVSASWSVLRPALLPSLMAFLSKNTHNDYPQTVFEVSEAARIDESQETGVESAYRLAFAACSATATFTEARQALDAFMANCGIAFEVRGIEHPSFLEGRVGAIVVDGIERGIIGEIHPRVLEAWGLEHPVAAVELALERLLE